MRRNKEAIPTYNPTERVMRERVCETYGVGWPQMNGRTYGNGRLARLTLILLLRDFGLSDKIISWTLNSSTTTIAENRQAAEGMVGRDPKFTETYQSLHDEFFPVEQPD